MKYLKKAAAETLLSATLGERVAILEHVGTAAGINLCVSDMVPRGQLVLLQGDRRLTITSVEE